MDASSCIRCRLLTLEMAVQRMASADGAQQRLELQGRGSGRVEQGRYVELDQCRATGLEGCLQCRAETVDTRHPARPDPEATRQIFEIGGVEVDGDVSPLHPAVGQISDRALTMIVEDDDAYPNQL